MKAGAAAPAFVFGAKQDVRPVKTAVSGEQSRKTQGVLLTLILVINYTIINCIKSIKPGGFHAREKRNGIFSLACVLFAMMGLPGCAQRAARRDTKGLFSWRALSEGRGGALLELAQSQDITEFNGTLIISGAFGLFKEDTVVAAGGYDAGTLGEDMELVVKLHVYCPATTGSGVPSGTSPTLYAGARRRPI